MKIQIIKSFDSNKVSSRKTSEFYDRIRNSRQAELCIIGLRFLMGMAFIPSGIVKVEGQRFTLLSVETKIGYFFEALFQASEYWKFIGIIQLTAAFLLFTQKFATLGNLIFFVIISNIFIITVDLNFNGTWVITGLLLMSSILLILWDWFKFSLLVGINRVYLDKTSYREPKVIWQVVGALLFLSLLVTVLLAG